MTAPLRLRARRALRLSGHLALTWTGALLAPRLAPADRQRISRRLARRTLTILGVGVTVRGEPPRRGPCLLVANHVSWLDVYALNAVCEARFVAKSEIARWPIAGRIARGFDTLFIRRGSFRDAARVKDRVAAALAAGEVVVVFPEGTTTDGTTLRPFRAALLQAAIDAGAPVQSVAVRYPNLDGTAHPGPAFVDDMTFLESLRRILRLPALRARLVFGPRLDAARASRRELATETHATVARALGVRGEPTTQREPRRRLAAAS